MAKYFVLSKRQQGQVIQHSQLDLQPSRTIHLGDSSLYVFPNPSSAPQSPSQISDISVPTDCSISVGLSSPDGVSELASPHNAHGTHTWIPPSPLFYSNVSDAGEPFNVEQWEAEASAAIDSSLLAELFDGLERPDGRWQAITRRRERDQKLQSKPFSKIASTPSATILPHIHIPLLSFLVSFLSVDESTLHLLTHPSSHTGLFPGHEVLLPADMEDEEQKDGALHAVEKLLAREDASLMVRKGLAVASDPSIPTSTSFINASFRISSLWDLFSGLMTNGSKALREVLQT